LGNAEFIRVKRSIVRRQNRRVAIGLRALKCPIGLELVVVGVQQITSPTPLLPAH
jgi:hypothetical protein